VERAQGGNGRQRRDHAIGRHPEIDEARDLVGTGTSDCLSDRKAVAGRADERALVAVPTEGAVEQQVKVFGRDIRIIAEAKAAGQAPEEAE
jgi:hypothetical protein